MMPAFYGIAAPIIVEYALHIKMRHKGFDIICEVGYWLSSNGFTTCAE